MAGTRDFISGVVWGGLVGAAIGMLMAPRSGEETRALLRQQSEEFQMQARETADNLRTKATETAEQARERATQLQQRGKALIEENRERITRTAEAVVQTAKETAAAPVAGHHQAGQGGAMTGSLSGPGAQSGQAGGAQTPGQQGAQPRTTTPGQSRPQGGSGV